MVFESTIIIVILIKLKVLVVLSNVYQITQAHGDVDQYLHMEEEEPEILPNQNGGPQTMLQKTTPQLQLVKGQIQRIAMPGPFPLHKSIPEVMYLALILELIWDPILSPV